MIALGPEAEVVDVEGEVIKNHNIIHAPAVLPAAAADVLRSAGHAVRCAGTYVIATTPTSRRRTAGKLASGGALGLRSHIVFTAEDNYGAYGHRKLKDSHK